LAHHFGLYYGAADGAELTFVDRNEKGGDVGSPPNWQVPVSSTFTPAATDRIYVVAWNDGGQQMWMGNFNLPGGQTLLSNTTDWQWAAGSGANPGPQGDVPSITTLTSDSQNANWQTVIASLPYGTSPWSPVAGINSSAARQKI